MPANKRGAPSASEPSAKKRKTDLKKWYAVKVGNRPGVYETWAECQALTAGFRGAVYKSFLSEEEAKAFVAGKKIPNSSGKPEPVKYYAVARGSFTGIFNDWEKASLAIAGTKGPKYKKFERLHDAVAFIQQWGDEATISKVLAATGMGPTEEDEDEDDDDDDDDEDDEDDDSAESGLAQIYTDGSSLGNGKVGSSAGVGVYFGRNDARNISERLEGEPQTNQRAELTAILRALEATPATQGVQILTDSKYSINCVTAWYKSWERNNWRTSTQEDVKNKDLVQAIRKKITEREAAGTQTVFTWVKGHANTAGNVAADQLAVAGARKPLPTTKGRRKLKTEIDEDFETQLLF